MKIYLRPLLYLFEKNIGELITRSAGFLEKTNFYLLVFTYCTQLNLFMLLHSLGYFIWKELTNFIEVPEYIHSNIECMVWH